MGSGRAFETLHIFLPVPLGVALRRGQGAHEDADQVGGEVTKRESLRRGEGRWEFGQQEKSPGALGACSARESPWQPRLRRGSGVVPGPAPRSAGSAPPHRIL